MVEVNWNCDTVISGRLDSALEDVREHLQSIMLKGRCSIALEIELACAYVLRTMHVFAVYDAIAHLERGNRVRLTKPASPLRNAEFRGVYHQHIFQPGDVLHNLLNDLTTTPRLERFFDRHEGKYVDNILGELSHELVIKSYEQRAKAGKLTSGTWLMFDRVNGANEYLAIASHSPNPNSNASESWAEALRARLDRSRMLLNQTT